ncbi:ferredoxin [Spongiactinospora sp. TRM90649]|uniref:ferredoxin n=1 Tax=Spongiactinospora sp. TRM90649 TaxID=3031114 RepID=UPI0023F9307B|nr:ferredoxin [Spongiactinospora sp. TRM90649]MDF5754531.1 ferredoxin [Spongiactinospora sp. TRM90649]
MTITADRDRCIGAGQCAHHAPDLFDSGEDGLVLILVPEPGPDQEGRAKDAARFCPVRAIAVT